MGALDMAATDQTYRGQKTLDLVFGVSGILMLLSMVGMFAQDYFRPFKTEQRAFRDVEYGMAVRGLLDLLPQSILTEIRAAEKEKDADRLQEAYAALAKYLDNISDAERNVSAARMELSQKQKDAAGQLHAAEVLKTQKDYAYRGIKATYDSKESLYNIAVDQSDKAPDSQKKALKDHVQRLKDELDNLRDQRDKAQAEFAQADADFHKLEVDAGTAEAQAKLSDADGNLKKVTADLDRLDKLAQQKRWKATDWLLSQPVLDAFNSPYRIQQYTLADYPIDYSFKYVTRFDRCTTCHLGMEKANFERSALKSLVKPPQELQDNLAAFHKLMDSPPAPLQESAKHFKDALAERKRRDGSGQGFDLSDLPMQAPTVDKSELTDARIVQFAAHPRLDLFVDANSLHPAEKFGCTSCHSGQGSATDFTNAAHAPANWQQHEQWVNEHGWEASHFWDFPMVAKRFQESECLKCHHQVTDLVRYGNQVEAPQLTRGFQLVRDNGCFGCHEIAGLKRGLEIGPDLRLEPGIPLDKMDPPERARVEADKSNPPGTLRKVGPSLFRLAEKTNEDWVMGWVWRPRAFRPDTKMPHFYGVSNIDAEALKDTGQEDYPAAEVRAIAFYLMHESREYLQGYDHDAWHRTNLAMKQWYQDKKRQQGELTDPQKKELAEIEHRLEKAGAPLLELRLDPGEKPRSISTQIVDADFRVVPMPAPPKDADGKRQELARGRKLFSEKGCLACHYHEGTTKGGTGDAPDVVSTATFGPDLSHVSAKLGAQPGDENARRWLVQWILNPQVHFPRTRMPFTHVTPDEAAAVAAWLLSEGKDWKGEEVPKPPNPMDTYKSLAKLYLSKAHRNEEINDFFATEAGGPLPKWLQDLSPDADEAVLKGGVTEDSLKLYVAKKAVNRLGCFGCHNVPGFEISKPIGTPLNDWGKKDPERLAFEDAASYVHDHHDIVASRTDPKDPSKLSKEWSSVKDGKTPYEQFYADLLENDTREGFLHQKLAEPRSYDYHRPRAWDDRLRMPQFRFARTVQRPDEDAAAYEVRQRTQEEEAREAVMTFVLGLVAEPVPAAYLSRPSGDRLAEVKGRLVLEQANCIGCHTVRPGVYEFKLTDQARQRLEGSYDNNALSRTTDFTESPAASLFQAHNAWAGTEPPKGVDRLRAFGVEFNVEGPSIRLNQALRFTNSKGQAVDLRANSLIQLPDDLVQRSEPFGGVFTDLMIDYQKKARSQQFPDNDKARSSLPPQLIREGERTRPDWLFQFLREPTIIRPQGYMLLRMPRFNLSDDEFVALVNYFNGVDRANNAGIGMEYPYVAGARDDEGTWREATTRYRNRLGKPKLDERAKQLEPLWQFALKDRLDDTKNKLAAAEDAVKAAKDPDKTKAEEERDRLQKEVKALEEQVQKRDVSDFRRDWEETGVYADDAYRLLTAVDPSTQLCASCHSVGDVTNPDPKGPNLALSAARLRPEWTLRWLCYPERLLTPTIMPQNFPNGKEQYKAIFDGSSLEQATALRDVLMNLNKVADRPENRARRPAAGGAQ
jgi:mono/diheme cytochrome c family protein